MDIGQELAHPSPLGALDPRMKLIGLVLISAVYAFLTAPSVLAVCVGFSLALAALSGMTARDLGLRLAAANIFILFLWLFLPWSMPGETLFAVGPLAVSRQGTLYTLALTLRANALVIVLMAFMHATPMPSIAHAMSRLGVPDKLAALFLFTYRYIHEISKEHNRLRDAMRVRSFTPGTNLHTYRSYAWLVGMLLVNSYERACRVRTAMVLRGFNGRFPCLDEGRISRQDLLSLAVLCLALAGFLYADA